MLVCDVCLIELYCSMPTALQQNCLTDHSYFFLNGRQELITTVSMYVAIALVIILMARMAYSFHAQKCCKESWDHKVHWSELLQFLITGVTIFVVAVPEGLPLAGPDTFTSTSFPYAHICKM